MPFDNTAKRERSPPKKRKVDDGQLPNGTQMNLRANARNAVPQLTSECQRTFARSRNFQPLNRNQGKMKNTARKSMPSVSYSVQNKNPPFRSILIKTVPGKGSTSKPPSDLIEMDWETSYTNDTTHSLDKGDTIGTSADDSVVILDTKCVTPKHRSLDNSIMIVHSNIKGPVHKQASDDVVIISDEEDVCAPGNVPKRHCNGTKVTVTNSVSKTNEVICISNPTSTKRKKKKKKKKKSSLTNANSNPNSSLPSTPNVNSHQTSSKSWVHHLEARPAVKIVSEIINNPSTFNCKSKSVTECQNSRDCLIHSKTITPLENRSVVLSKRCLDLRVTSGKNRPVCQVTHFRPNDVRSIPNTNFYNDVRSIPITNVYNATRSVPIATFYNDEPNTNFQNALVSMPNQILQNRVNTTLYHPMAVTRSASGFVQNQLIRKRRLRPIVVDGSNVAFHHGQKEKKFSCKGIELCVQYFQSRGHEVTVFVPQYRRCKSKEVVGVEILERLGNKQVVVFTPSRTVNGTLISSYDDRFILDLAAQNGGIIVSNDNYRDIKGDKMEWRRTVDERLLMFVFVGDHFMVPDDPLGRRGVCLEDFLSFPSYAS